VATVKRLPQDVFFKYDRAELTSAALAALDRNAALLLTLLAEFLASKSPSKGTGDERGSAEYNLALGDRRLRGAAEVLSENRSPKRFCKS